MTDKKEYKSDFTLKMMCKILFRIMGFCAHCEVKLRTKSYVDLYRKHDISDIDVLGYKFFPDLSYMTVGSECKSGEEGALDEIYKLIGVRDYFSLDKAYFLKKKIHQNARQVALSSKIMTFSEAEFRVLLFGLGVDVDKEIKIEKAIYFNLKNAREYIKKVDEKLLSYMLFEYWNKENWRNIHNIIYRLESLKDISEKNISIEFKLYLYNTLELLIRSILLNVSRAMSLNYSDIENSSKVLLFGDAESLHERRKLLDLVNIELGGQNGLKASWQEDYIDLCRRFSEKPNYSSLMPDLIHDIVNNSFYERMIIIDKKLIAKYNEITRKFIQDIIQFLEKNLDLNKKFFKEFMEL